MTTSSVLRIILSLAIVGRLACARLTARRRGVAMRRRCCSPAAARRRCAARRRSTAGLAAVARQPAGQARAGVDPARRRGAVGLPPDADRVLLARRADRARQARHALARHPVLPDPQRQDRPPAAAQRARRGEARRPRAPASSTTCTRSAAIRCSSGSRRFPTSRCACSIRSAAGATGCVSKYVSSLADFSRLNRRMHNKLFIADSAIVVAGGRNIADEYFMRSMTDNFVDMDALIVGAVVPQLDQHLRHATGTAVTSIPVARRDQDRPRRARQLQQALQRARRRRRPDDGAHAAAGRHPGLRPDQRRHRRRPARACTGARRPRSPTRPRRSRR